MQIDSACLAIYEAIAFFSGLIELFSHSKCYPLSDLTCGKNSAPSSLPVLFPCYISSISPAGFSFIMFPQQPERRSARTEALTSQLVQVPNIASDSFPALFPLFAQLLISSAFFFLLFL